MTYAVGKQAFGKFYRSGNLTHCIGTLCYAMTFSLIVNFIDLGANTLHWQHYFMQ